MTDRPSSTQIAIGSNIVQADRGGKASLTIIQQAPLKPIPAIPPSPPRNFIGRIQQLSDLIAAITSANTNQIIAIQGMGGIGKTALVKQVAREVKSKFPGGIFWGDELPSKDSNPNIILKQWGRICGQNLEKESEENLPSVVRGLLTAYESEFGSVLVIVDDVRLDWLGDGVRIIRQALPPGVSLLITTRQTQIAQDLDAKIFILDVFSRAESIQLLLSLSEGKITDSQARNISELCGDMPLALELIAKLAKRRKSDWLLGRLQGEANRLNILKLDEAHKKEQSVLISFEISYQSLAEHHAKSARIFRHLAAFAQPIFIIFDHLTQTLAQVNKHRFSGGNSEEGNERVVGDDLLRLADWSLLSEENIEGSESQYFYMHTLLHEYAQSLLTDAAEIDEAVQTHAKYCAAFAEANPHLDLQIHSKSTLEFEKSYGQLHQALEQIKYRHIANGTDWENEPVIALQIISLVDATDHHWQWHSQFAEQVDWLQVAYKCAGALGNNIKQADFARRIGRVLSILGQLDEAIEWMNRSEEALGENVREEANAIRALMYIHRASIIYQKGETDMAEEDCLHGLELVDEKRQPRVYAEGNNLLGAIKMKSSKLTSALEAFEISLSVWKQIGDRYQINRVEDNIRAALYYLGDIAYLRKAMDESLQYWEQFPNRIELAMALTNRGVVHHLDGEYGMAIELQKRAMEISDMLAVPRIRAVTRSNIADPYISLEKYKEAETYLNQSLEIQMEFDIKDNWIDAKRLLAEVALGRRLGQQAIKLAEHALDLAREDDDPLEEGAALRVFGEAHQLNGDLEQAKELLEASLSQLRENEYKYESYLTLQALTKLYGAMGDTEKVKTITDEAQSLAKEMGINQPKTSSE